MCVDFSLSTRGFRALLVSSSRSVGGLPWFLARLATTLWKRTVRSFARAVVVNQIPRWDPIRSQWNKKIDWVAWLSTIVRWSIHIIKPSSAILYTIQSPSITRHTRPFILHAIPNVFLGGSTQIVVDIHNRLGDEFDFEVLSAAVPRFRRHQNMVVHLQPSPADPDQIETMLRRRPPDLLHVHFWGDADMPWYNAVFAAAEATGRIALQNINTPIAPHNSRAILMNAFVSHTVRALDKAAIRPGRVIYPGIDLDVFRPRTFEANAEKSIGMVYRLQLDKLNLDSIELFIELVRRHPMLRVFIIGDGELFHPFVECTKKTGVFENFVFAGPVPYASLPSWYSKFKLFVAPVWQESFGQVTPFAMAMGLAVAGNRIGALPEILDNDETLGATFDETVTKITTLIKNPARVEHLGALNRARALELFSVVTMANSYRDLYRDLLEQHSTAISMGTMSQ